MRGRRARERGSASVELVLVTPVLIALLLFVVALGRLAGARGEVDAAGADRRGLLAARSQGQGTRRQHADRDESRLAVGPDHEPLR